MFVCNVKVNGNKLGKILIIILFIIVTIITAIILYKIICNNFFKTNDTIQSQEIYELTSSNYTNVLKAVHDDVSKYVGQKIKFSGYVYRMLDFNDNQFVLARNMVISSDFQTVVVGFLCECNEINQFEDNCWIELEGVIKKGSYHGEIPIIQVETIHKKEKPSDEYVYPPDDSFVPTSTIL